MGPLGLTNETYSKEQSAMSNQDTVTRTAKMEIFALLGYQMLSTPDSEGKPYRWRHVVFSGYNEAFRKFFPTEDVRQSFDELRNAGMVVTTLAKGGITFVPEPKLLRKLSSEEKAFAQTVREHLEAFSAERAAKKAASAARKAAASEAVLATPEPVRTADEVKAATLFGEGKTAEAMKLLGYPD
jgi:hypothetical protein